MTPEGEYAIPYKDPRKQQGSSLAALTVGRFGVLNATISFLGSALTIAIRFSKVENSYNPGCVWFVLSFQEKESFYMYV